MYKLLVQVLDLDAKGDPVIHEIHSKEFSSIQEAMEALKDKDLFKYYLECENEILKDLNEMKNREPRHG